MDELNDQTEQTPESQYTPRPHWQVWLARIGLVVFLGFLILYYIIFFRGGA